MGVVYGYLLFPNGHEAELDSGFWMKAPFLGSGLNSEILPIDPMEGKQGYLSFRTKATIWELDEIKQALYDWDGCIYGNEDCGDTYFIVEKSYELRDDGLTYDTIGHYDIDNPQGNKWSRGWYEYETYQWCNPLHIQSKDGVLQYQQDILATQKIG